MTTILLTGANGFVGQHLGAHLIQHGHQIIATTRRNQVEFDYTPSRVAKVNVIDENTDWMTALEGVDVVIHLAARVHILREKSVDPLMEFRMMNVEGTLRLARQAAESGVKRFVFLSSIGVNGRSTTSRPFCEDDQAAPEDPYAQSKLEAEQRLMALAFESGLEVCIVRPPLVYGPRAPGNFLRLLGIAAKGWPLPLASIDNKRSLVGIENLCSLIGVCTTHPKAAGEIFLVSDGQDISTPELIRVLAEAMGRPYRLWPFPTSILAIISKFLGQSGVWARLAGSLQADISKARQQLDWEPSSTLQQGLANTAAWYQKSHLANE